MLVNSSLAAPAPQKQHSHSEHRAGYGEDPVGSGRDLTIMVVEHPSLAMLLKTSFEATWERGLTIDQAEERYAAAKPLSA